VTSLEIEPVPSAYPDATVVEVRGEIDLTNAGELSARLAEHVATRLLVVDLMRVSFVDSAALHCLFRVARERGRSAFVLVVDPSSPIAGTFEIVQMGRAAPIVSAVEDAFAQLAET
jgi:anti-anti-sigma factor